MLLFQKRFHAGLLQGSITLTFRRWPHARVKPQGRYRVHPLGVVEVDAVNPVRWSDVTEADARAAGFESRAELATYLKSGAPQPLRAQTSLFRVQLHHGGDGDRVPLALVDQLGPGDLDDIEAALLRLDGTSPWTRETLEAIARHPRVAASQLARQLGRDELAAFKADVVKLKKRGLTQSFEVGYELSPRGKAWFESARGRKWRRKAPRLGRRNEVNVVAR